MKGKFSSMGRVAIALVLALSLCLVMTVPVSAAVGITTADADIDADTFITGLYTDLPAIVITESLAGEIDISGGGTIILDVPTGFVFRTSSNPDVAVTGAGELVAVFTSISTTQLTVTVTTASTSEPNILTIGGVTAIGVKPLQGTLESGDIVMAAASLAVIAGVTEDITPFGTLTEVPGAVAQLAYTLKPATVVAGVETSKFTVQRQDQFDNPTTSGATIVGLASDSTGAAKEFRATAAGAAVVEVTIADAASTADFYYCDEKAGAWTITASSGVLTSAESALTVGPEVLAAYTVVPATLTPTAGTPFNVVITAVDEFENPLGTDYDTDAGPYTWETNAGGTPNISTPLVFGNFGGVGVATKAVTLDAIETGVTFTVTDSNEPAITGTSAGVEVVAGPAGYLVVTGTATMTAGGTNELTVTAYDAAGNPATSYEGEKTLVFSGLGVAPDATAPTVEGVTMENETTVTFTAGVSVALSTTLIAYNAETTTVDVTDGAVDSAGHGLALIVAPAAAAQLAYTGGPATIVAGVETTAFTVQRQDQYANPVISGETIVGLASDSTGIAKKFMATSGGDPVASITIPDTESTAGFYYDDEKAGDWTLTASATGLTSAESALTVGPAGIDHYAVSPIASPQVEGAAFEVTIQAQDVFDNNITLGVEAAEAISITYGVIDGPATPDVIATTAEGAATVDVRLTVITLGQSITFAGDVSTMDGTSNPFQVVAVGAIDHYAVTAAVDPQVVNVQFTVIIQAKDAAGNDITVGGDIAETITVTCDLTDADLQVVGNDTIGGTASVQITLATAQAGQTITFEGVTSGAYVTTDPFSVYDVIMVPFSPDAWMLISTDIWINSTESAWIAEPVLVYKAAGSVFSSEVTLADLKPVEALYVKGGTLGLIFSTGVQGLSAKELATGWNLISSANSEAGNAPDVLSGLRDVAGDGTGLTTVVSQGIYNTNSIDFYVDATEWDNLILVDLKASDGYWIRMNAAKTFGVVPQLP